MLVVAVPLRLGNLLYRNRYRVTREIHLSVSVQPEAELLRGFHNLPYTLSKEVKIQYIYNILLVRTILLMLKAK